MDEKKATPFQSRRNKDVSYTPNEYTPWNESYSNSVILIGVATLLVWLAGFVGIFSGDYKIAILIISMIFAFMSIAYYKQGSIREFGKHFEGKWVEKARERLAGTKFSVGRSVMTSGGDIDLLVIDEKNNKYNVEIKSWQSWGDDPIYKRRERKVLTQIEKQAKGAAVFASILWLPQGKETIQQALFGGRQKIGDGVYLCRGDAKKLRQALEKISP